MHILLYSHSDYDYVWPVWSRQTERFLGDVKTSFFVNKETEQSKVFKNTDFYFYDDSHAYTDRMSSLLKKLPLDEVVLFQHEDMFLYDFPDIFLLEQFAGFVREGKADSIQLIRTTPGLEPSIIDENLYFLPENLKFCIQPTLVTAGKLFEIFSKAKNTNIWDFERWCTRNCGNLNSYFFYSGENKRGLDHYDSKIYPYIATAIVKGKWNFKEYEKELSEILKL
jgi:hypothetical protein